MIFKLSLRPIQLSDIGPECAFMPEDEEYERCFNAIVQDIESIDGVASVITSDANEITVDAGPLELGNFKAALKPLLQHNFQHLRFSELTEAEGGSE